MTPRLLKLSLLLCALTLCMGVRAQSYVQRPRVSETTFSGNLLDSLTKEPLRAAVISVVSWDYDGNRVVRNYVSDEKGGFSFLCTYTPYHRMEVAMLGYKPYVRNLVITKVSTDMYSDTEKESLGQILMSQSTQEIDEVVVKARLQMYKMKGDTIIFMPRAVNTMRDDAALEILRQMPGVEVDNSGGVKILGQTVERTYVNEKLLFGNDPTAALRELDAKEVASIEAYDEVDEADAAIHGEKARKRKVLNVVTFKEFTQSYSAKARGEMGTDFRDNAAGERPVRYAASGNVNFFSERLQFNAAGGANNLTADEGSWLPTAYTSKRKSNASANVSGRSGNNKHNYSAGYSYGGGMEAKRSSSTSDFFSTDYFTSQHIERDKRSERESDNHNFSGGYDYAGERSRYATSLRASFGNGTNLEQSSEQITRDGKALSANDIADKNRYDSRSIDWSANGDWRLKNDNSISFSARTNLNEARSRGVRLERRMTEGVETPLEWETYSPTPDNEVSGGVGYTLDFDKAGRLTLGSGVRYAGRAERMLYTDLQTGVLDLVRSEDAFDKTTVWNIGPRYSLSGKDFDFSAEVDYTLENRAYEDAKAGRIDRRNFHFVTGRLAYNLNKPKKNFRVSFDNSYMPVSARHFSSRLDDTNPLYVTTGNASLVPEKEYALQLSSEFLGAKASYKFSAQLDAKTDPIIRRRRFFKEATLLPEYDNYLMPAGSTLTTPENGAAYLRFSARASYKVRIAPLRLFLDMDVSYDFSNPEEELYDKKERIARHGVSQTTRITTNFSPKFRINVQNILDVNFLKRFGNSSREFRDVLTGSLEWDIIPILYLRGDYTGIFSSSSGMFSTPDAHLLSLSLGCRVLKERGRIAFNAYDVLNDYSPIRIGQSLDAISRSVEYVGANYFTVSFEYKFNNRRATN